MLIETRQKHQKEKLSLSTPMEQVSERRLPGITVDEQLKINGRHIFTTFTELFLGTLFSFQN